ncbi:MAG: MlaD family protein, partial [Poseidonibacter sp.]|uniref:MlaD family protein n=1 Tax=Poseidonibacter sp. TaxID=2321188 RepID=UPI00359DB25F
DSKYSLYAKDLNSISKNSKIYFKNIEIGKVLDYSLSKDLNKVKIEISIYEKYNKLINNHTMFYDMSSKLIDIKNLDVNVNYAGLKPLLNGAIAIVDVKRKDKLSKTSFKLYSSYKDVQKIKRIHNEGSLITAYFDDDFKIKEDMAIMYKNQEIGFVKSINFKDNNSKAKLFIYKKYKKYLNKNSRFYKKSVVNLNASLNGLIFEIEDFSSLLNGAIYLDSNTKVKYSKYKIFSSLEDMQNSTNSISIIFDEVEDVKKDFSALTYKGVNIGKVTNISLLKNQKVKVDALIFDDYNSIAKKGTIFYLKKPIVSLDKIENIGSAIMAVDIGVIKSSNKKIQKEFIGLSKKPAFSNLDKGILLKVHSYHASSAGINSPIYYKNVQIGKINNIDLSNDGTKVIMDCLIFDKYSKFVRDNSTFYDISGFNLKFSIFSGTKVESNTFTSLLKGGLVVVTPMDYEKKADKNSTFILKEELIEDWQSISPSIK